MKTELHLRTSTRLDRRLLTIIDGAMMIEPPTTKEGESEEDARDREARETSRDRMEDQLAKLCLILSASPEEVTPGGKVYEAIMSFDEGDKSPWRRLLHEFEAGMNHDFEMQLPGALADFRRRQKEEDDSLPPLIEEAKGKK